MAGELNQEQMANVLAAVSKITDLEQAIENLRQMFLADLASRQGDPPPNRQKFSSRRYAGESSYQSLGDRAPLPFLHTHGGRGKRPFMHQEEPRPDHNQRTFRWEFPFFSPTDLPEGWINRCTSFFQHQRIPYAEWVDTAASHLQGSAQVWWKSTNIKFPGLRWEDFCRLFRRQCAVAGMTTPLAALIALQQTDSVDQLNEKWREVSAALPNLDDETEVTLYLQALDPSIATDVLVKDPLHIHDAMHFARAFEAKLSAQAQQSRSYRPNTVNHRRAIATGLRALKLLGVDGVELPIWWGIVENEARGKYDWTGYLAIVEMVQQLGLEVHMSLCFHGSQEAQISIPQWVEKIGSSDSSIYFTDRSGHQYKDCLSLSVDELPVLEGKTPVEVYRDFCESFRSSFSSFLGSTITGLSIGLGPDGELRYPSTKGENLDHAGEFQCHARHLLENLKHHAEMKGNPLWRLGGPHDVGSQSPLSGGFFAENGGSWESPYGEFFLSWYAGQLIQHGDRMLSLAASTFKDVAISLSGKIPLMHSSYKSRSHPSELTAGFYNTEKRDGYREVAEMFSRHSCMVVIPGFHLSDNNQPRSNPESLREQIMSSCREQGSKVSVESTVSGRFDCIKKNIMGATSVVERMGAHFISPEHFPAFTGFVRGLNQPDQCLEIDDLARCESKPGIKFLCESPDARSLE